MLSHQCGIQKIAARSSDQNAQPRASAAEQLRSEVAVRNAEREIAEDVPDIGVQRQRGWGRRGLAFTANGLSEKKKATFPEHGRGRRRAAV